jgi:hypothetical protein
MITISSEGANFAMTKKGTEMKKDTTRARVIQGTILACVDGHWTDRDGLTPPTELLVLGTTRALQCWRDGQVLDALIDSDGEPLPDVDELNAQVPESDWEISKYDNKPRPPWQLNFVAYFSIPKRPKPTPSSTRRQGRALPSSG